MAENEEKLTDKQEEFCYAYTHVTLFDAIEAVSIVYNITSKKDKQSQARNLLNDPVIKKRISELMKDRESSPVVDKYYVLTKLRSIVEKCEGKPQYQTKALELLGKSLGMFNDRVGLDVDVRDAATMAQEAFNNRKVMENKDNILKLFDKQVKEGDSNVATGLGETDDGLGSGLSA